MRDIQLPLRTAYMTALAAVTVDGVSTPVYDEQAPENAPDHYMIITNQTDKEVSVKGAFKNDAYITVDIVTNFKPGKGGKELSERIADAVLQIIRSGNVAIEAGFQIVKTKKDSSESLVEHLKTRSIFRRILIFKHKIVQT